MDYWRAWQTNAPFFACQGKCLAVRLCAEVADLSENMRVTLKRGTARVIGRLQRASKASLRKGRTR